MDRSGEGRSAVIKPAFGQMKRGNWVPVPPRFKPGTYRTRTRRVSVRCINAVWLGRPKASYRTVLYYELSCVHWNVFIHARMCNPHAWRNKPLLNPKSDVRKKQPKNIHSCRLLREEHLSVLLRSGTPVFARVSGKLHNAIEELYHRVTSRLLFWGTGRGELALQTFRDVGNCSWNCNNSHF